MGALQYNKASQNKYIGRFAPSPTGHLHYGSLIAAVASYLQAKKNSGLWLLRIEDIDPPREVEGATDEIFRALELYQFEWDQQPLYQSTNFEIYREHIEKLEQYNLIYACSCSRKQLNLNTQKSVLGKRYPGTCQSKQLDLDNSNYGLRLRTPNANVKFRDGIFGNQECSINKDIGDFIIFRKHDLPAYALAVAVDDAFQGITEVVRGCDLLAFTPLQIHLCTLLNFTIPKFFHIPLILDQHGKKLSKQTGARELSKDNITHVLVQALNDLGQNAPEALSIENLHAIWQWAFTHWDAGKIPKTKGLAYYQN